MADGPPKKKCKLSAVWNHLTKSAQSNSTAVCCYCKKFFKSSGNTSNLWDDLSRCSLYLASKEKQPLPIDESPSTSNSGPLKPEAQRTLENYISNAQKYASESRRKKEIDEAVALMVIKDFQPFSIVNDEGFVNLVRVLDPRYRLPSKTTLRNVLIENKYKSVKLQLKNELTAVEYISVTCDLWSSKAMESYLTATCHYIDINFVLKTKVLSTKPLISQTNHSAENIASSLSEIFEEWKVGDKVICIVTDNAHAMIKACELLKKPHLSCVCHSINLVVQDCLKIDDVALLLKKCKEIVRYFKTSSIAMSKLLAEQTIENPLKVIQEVPTRWNSSYEMIARIIHIKDAINISLLSGKKNAPKPLASDEIDALKELQVILKLFDDLTLQLSSSSKVTSSLIIPLICGLTIELQNIGNKVNTSEAKKFLAGIQFAVQKRLFCYEGQKIPQLSTILDPRFKKEGFRSSENAWNASKALEAEMIELSLSKTQNSSDAEGSGDSVDTRNVSAPKRTSNLFNFLQNRVNNKTNKTPAVAVLQTKQRYLEQLNFDQNANPLMFWKVNNNIQFDSLPTFAQKYLCIPASSVESERMFSKAGLIVSDRRTRLKSKTVEVLIFLQKNVEIMPISDID